VGSAGGLEFGRLVSVGPGGKGHRQSRKAVERSMSTVAFYLTSCLIIAILTAYLTIRVLELAAK